MLSDSGGRPGFKSRSSPTLETCNFEALEVTAMYFTFLETSNLFLFGQVKSLAVCSVYDMLSGIPIGLLHTKGLLPFVFLSTTKTNIQIKSEHGIIFHFMLVESEDL